jgi:hypothetical protein
MAHALLRAALVLGCLLAGGCGPTLGRHGRLGFAYHAGDELLWSSMERPLARGARAIAVVHASRRPGARPTVVWGRRTLASPKPVRVDSATASNPDVLQVLGTNDDRVELRGLSAGRSDLTVHTARGSDTITVTVATTHHLELDHAAWARAGIGPGQSVLLAGGVVHFAARRVDARGRALAGLDPAREVDVAPASRARTTRREGDGSHLRLALGQPGRLTLTPRAGTGYRLEVVPLERVSALSIEFIRARNVTGAAGLRRGDAIWLRVDARTRDGQWALGLDKLLQLRSATPSRCELRSLSRWLGDGLFALRGLAPGECRLQARLGAASATASVTVE